MTKWLCLGTLGAAAASGVLNALGYPFGGRATISMVALTVVGGLVNLLALMDEGRRRYLALQECARLTIGPEGVTAEDRAGGRQSWPRTTITAVNVTRQYTGDECGNSQVYYVVRMSVADGSSVPLWSRATRDGLPHFDVTEYSEPNIRAAAAWLSQTVRRAVGLSGVGGRNTTTAPQDAEPIAAADGGT